MINREIFMKNLKALRKQFKLSQDELSKLIGIKKTTIVNIECKDAEPTMTVLIKMSQFFKVPIDFLVGNGTIGEPTRYYKETEENKKQCDILLFVRSLKEIMTISIEVENSSARNIFYQIIKNSLSEKETMLMTRLFFISESIGQNDEGVNGNVDQVIEFLHEVGLLRYLNEWMYLTKEQAIRIAELLLGDTQTNLE